MVEKRKVINCPKCGEHQAIETYLEEGNVETISYECLACGDADAEVYVHD